jgi:hypothetical protein
MMFVDISQPFYPIAVTAVDEHQNSAVPPQVPALERFVYIPVQDDATGQASARESSGLSIIAGIREALPRIRRVIISPSSLRESPQ